MRPKPPSGVVFDREVKSLAGGTPRRAIATAADKLISRKGDLPPWQLGGFLLLFVALVVLGGQAADAPRRLILYSSQARFADGTVCELKTIYDFPAKSGHWRNVGYRATICLADEDGAPHRAYSTGLPSDVVQGRGCPSDTCRQTRAMVSWSALAMTTARS